MCCSWIHKTKQNIFDVCCTSFILWAFLCRRHAYFWPTKCDMVNDHVVHQLLLKKVFRADDFQKYQGRGLCHFPYSNRVAPPESRSKPALSPLLYTYQNGGGMQKEDRLFKIIWFASCVCMYVCVCVCVWCAHPECVCVHVTLCACVHQCKLVVCVCSYVHEYVSLTHISVCMCTCAQTSCKCVCVCVCAPPCMCACQCVCRDVRFYILPETSHQPIWHSMWLVCFSLNITYHVASFRDCWKKLQAYSTHCICMLYSCNSH